LFESCEVHFQWAFIHSPISDHSRYFISGAQLLRELARHLAKPSTLGPPRVIRLRVNWSTLGSGLLAAFTCGCTFYTSCPTGNQQQPNDGGSPSNGGSSGNGNGNESGAGPTLVAWQNVTNNLAGMDSSCGNLSVLMAKPDNVVLAGVNKHGLWATKDGGETWLELGQGEGSEPIPVTAGIRSITLDPADSNVYWLAVIYGPGVWRTDDNGETFKMLGTVRHNDLVSVDFSDPERRVLVAGGHEVRKTLWRSADAGATWDDIGSTLPDDSRASAFPLVLGPELHLLGASGFSPGVSGIFRTEDAGATWERVSERGGFGTPVTLSDGTILWPDEDGSLERSVDEGLTWEEVLPKNSSFGRQSLLQLPDGRLAMLSRYEGVKVVDADFTNLTQVTEKLPFGSDGLIYSVPNRAFFVWNEDCGEVVLDNAIMRADFDYEAE